MSLFAERLKTLRTTNHATQKEIAESLGITVRGYQFYEYAAKEPTMSNLIALADYFKVSIDYLVGRTDNPSINQ